MGFAYLLNSNDAIEAFKVMFGILNDVQIKYYPKGDIENDRQLRLIFIPLMVVLEGGVRFPLDPFLLKTLNFYKLNCDQCLPNFYKVVSSVSQLNQLYGLKLSHHDINYLTSGMAITSRYETLDLG